MIERTYVPEDTHLLIETCAASIRGLAAPYYSPEQLNAWAPTLADKARWHARLAALRTVIIESEGRIAGFASYTGSGYLDFLFTHPDFARHGVARRLYLSIESRLRALGVQRVTTHSSLAARPFFDRHGFEVEAEEVVECRGAFLKRFAMLKRLPPLAA